MLLPQQLNTLIQQIREIHHPLIESHFGKDLKETFLSFIEPGKDLKSLFAQVKNLSKSDRHRMAHCLTVELELINRCENAYRSHRLAHRDGPTENESPIDSQRLLYYVFTAHPTESRTSESVDLFDRLQRLLQREHLDIAAPDVHAQVKELISLGLSTLLAKHERPEVCDEAHYIYSIILRPRILNELLRTHKTQKVLYRAWVGGDKDGHPGVDEKAMLQSLDASRELLLAELNREFRYFSAQTQLALRRQKEVGFEKLVKEINRFSEQLTELKSVRAGDGGRIQGLQETLEKIKNFYQDVFATSAHPLQRITGFLNLFPGLVVPLEFREDQKLIEEALHSQDSLPIVRMLKTLEEISHGGQHQWYVRGFVISRFEAVSDFNNTLQLMQKHLSTILPTIPLFESKSAILNGVDFVNEIFAQEEVLAFAQKSWYGKFEVMIGYSDSAKELGAISSRSLIEKEINRLRQEIKAHGLRPIFFHGSGGSIARGGGSVQDQVSWWPQESLDIVKLTLQGEMIQRTFSSLEIFGSQRDKFFAAKANSCPPALSNPAFAKFAQLVENAYKEKVHNLAFMELVECATPYRFLHLLRMGSRPSKRKKEGPLSLESLRAIPWVLCWTQTRVLFSVWWGIGSAWQALSENEKLSFKSELAQSAFLRSLIKLLSFTLAKVDLDIWNVYLDELLEDDHWSQSFAEEYQKSLQFIKEISGEDDLLWFRPWLKESIELRSPLIDPLNLLQIVAIQENDEVLLRETATGIACGMLTTG